MSERGGILAILILAVCAAIGTFVLNSPNESSRAEAAHTDYCNAKLAPFGLSVSPEGNEAKGKREEADLCQQIVMAEAAVNSAWWARWQFYISFAGGLITAGIAWLAYRVAKKALFDLERPHVFVVVSKQGLGVDRNRGTFTLLVPGGFKYQIVNYGRTPARILEIVLRFEFVETPPPAMPVPINATDEARSIPDGEIAALNAPYEEGVNLMTELPGGIYEVNCIYGKQVFFLGRVRYADIFGDRYTVGFCLKFDHLGARFVRIGDERYNYTSKG